MSSGSADEAADRALTAVARKLDRALSTEYTVNELIAEATDPANLACMFIGTGSHLSKAIHFPPLLTDLCQVGAHICSLHFSFFVTFVAARTLSFPMQRTI